MSSFETFTNGPLQAAIHSPHSQVREQQGVTTRATPGNFCPSTVPALGLLEE